MSQSHRLFFALWPDNVTRHTLARWQSALSGRKIPVNNLHMTLIFLGAQSKEKIPVLSQLITTISFNAIELIIDKVGYFSRSQISWAGIQNAPATLFQLHAKLSKALLQQSISFDNRKNFKPHITLARHSNRPNKVDFKPIIWKADQLVLVESRFIKTSRGAYPQYTPIAKHFSGN